MADVVTAPASPVAPASPDAGGEEEVSTAAEGAGPAGESIANAADPDAAIAAEEEPEGPKRKKLKLGDREVEFDEDVAALIEERDQVFQKRKEHTRAANERFQQAAEVFKKIEGIKPEVLDALRNLQNDPWAVHRAMGADPTALVTDYAKQQLAQMEMTPEQRALSQREQQIAQREAQIAEHNQKIEQQEYQRQIDGVRQEFAKSLPPVLEKHNLPDDEFTAGEIGKIIAQQVRSGRQPDYEEAAEVQADRLTTQLTRYLDRLSRTPGALKKQFPDIAKRLREEDVASLIGPKAIRPGKPTNAPQPQQPSRPKTYAEEEREAKDRMYAALGRARPL